MAPGSGTRSILNSIPTEILREIALSVDTASDTSALCRTSKLLSVIATPVLYRHLYLDSVEKTLGCFDALSKNAKCHDYVRSVRVAIYTSDGDYVPSDVIFPLESVLRTLRNLQHLYLRLPDFDDRFLIIFATLTLPSLLTFSSPHTGSFSPLLSSFVNRHPHLTHLDLLSPWTVRRPDADNADFKLPLLHLPCLRCFRGCALYGQSLVVHLRTLVRADIWDAPPATDLDALLAALADATTPGTPFTLAFLWDGPLTALFAPLAAHLPHTSALATGPFQHPAPELTQEDIDTIAGALEALCGLASFDFANAAGTSGGHTVREDCAALTKWSMHCPSLITSRLHSRNWACVKGKWVLVQ
ncbi:hypothetical protein DFH07DRAFT_971485 [Mycena maculata]|uniref:F-box domain-containing protein n=1 Tax=Mycena maculata TaxID=230809 RepID=A0AAD7HLS8_9AGAR|nr:hypothetical protein DFH07DRAFT_971485 [Mycena maculata]